MTVVYGGGIRMICARILFLLEDYRTTIGHTMQLAQDVHQAESRIGTSALWTTQNVSSGTKQSF